MRRKLYGLLLCVVLLTGCQGKNQSTVTPESPAHNVPSAVYPGPNNTNPQVTGQSGQAYPGPQSGNTYPAPEKTAGQTPAANDYAPAPGDAKMTRGNAFVTLSESSVVLAATAPKQVSLRLKGTLPNPCYHLRINPALPDDQKKIQVEVYSVVEADQICTEVIQNFDVTFELGSFPTGHYTVYINGEYLGEFDA